MIDMALLSVIRRWHFRDRMPIREISQRTGLSRNTVRRYLQGGMVEPVFKAPDRPSKLVPFGDKLVLWLLTDSSKPRKYKRTAKQMHAELVVLGYAGSYGRVAAFIRDWEDGRHDTNHTIWGVVGPDPRNFKVAQAEPLLDATVSWLVGQVRAECEFVSNTKDS